MTDPSPVVRELAALPKLGAGVGLHRVLALCEDLRATAWWRGLDAIKVTGSNGKGSVCAMTAAVLGALGIATGRYTSPHLWRFHERVEVEGAPLTDDELAAAMAWLRARLDAHRRAHPDDVVGGFEAFTALALRHFATRAPRALVVEAGIGGRFDPTRVVPGRVAALASLDLEHTALLGSTLDVIAYDKADLCPDGGTLVVGWLDAEVHRRLAAYCALRGVTLVSAAERCAVGPVAYTDGAMALDLTVDGLALPALRVALQGPHQAANAAVALLLAATWLRDHAPDVTPDAFAAAARAALATVRWPARFQRVRRDPDVYVDAGHTPRAMDALVATTRAALAGARVLLVVGASHDKDVGAIAARLADVADRVICTRARHKGAAPDEVLRAVRRRRPGVPARVVPAVEDAVREAVAEAAAEGLTVVVAGGLFLAAEAAHALAGGRSADLWFF